jgi:succinoglycan biosynthesis transport protein ExoP
MSIVTVLVVAAGVSAVLLIPASYRSTATILVEQEEFSREVTGVEKSAYADRRINILSKRVLSSDSLSKLAKEFDLYEEANYKDGKLLRPTLAGLRKRIDVEPVTAEVIDSKTRFQVSATIAFNVAFIAADPLLAQRVTERLVQMFLDENAALLSRGSAAATDLLRKEEDQLAEKIEELEDKLKVFKESNVFSLPEMQNMNVEGLERITEELSSARLQLKTLQEQRIQLESELVRLSPNAIGYDAEGKRVLGHEDRLKVLRAEYAQKSEEYLPSHPDIQKLRREIARLESDLKASEKAETKSLPTALIDLKADNPAYITAASNLRSTMLEIETVEETLAQLEEDRKVYQDRIEKSPVVEREYVKLERDYEQAVEEYQTIRERRFAAQLSGAIDTSSTGQGLRVLEEPDYPEDPYKPNRKLLLFATLLLAVWAGFGTALVREHFDDRIWSVEDVVSELSEPPLSAIPTTRLRVPKTPALGEPIAKVAT